LNTDPVIGTGVTVSYSDNTAATLADGYYQYAVTTNYTLGQSAKTVSNVIDKGMYKMVTIHVTANNAADIDGAKVSFNHSNGAGINIYTGAVAQGSIVFNHVLKGNYTLNINKGATYYPFSEPYTVNSDTTLNAELTEYIFTPTMLDVTVDQENKQALFTWGLGNKKTYMVDDDTYEQALSLTSGSGAELGNYFDVAEAGQIYSVDLLAVEDATNNPNNEMGKVKLIAYNSNGDILGESALFELTTVDYINIPLDFVEFDGPFYLMVQWVESETLATHALAVDTDSDPGVAYYHDTDNGFIQLSEWGYWGNFLIRANVLVTGKKEIIQGAGNQVNQIKTSKPSNIREISAKGTLC
jgi:hypothetical protein